MIGENIYTINLEVTARCNAKCPMCSRTYNSDVLSNQGETTIEDIRRMFPKETVPDLSVVGFGGNFGDPIVAKDIIEMHEYFYNLNPNVKFVMTTNGGTRSVEFWKTLAKYYQKDSGSFVEWHIDGLQDTNHQYRVGVVWEKLIENATAFINAGGSAIWFFIPFFHNEHQIEEAKSLSEKLGFEKFVVKASTRFKDYTKPFRHKEGVLYPPTDPKYNLKGKNELGELYCFAEHRNQIYVDAWNRFFPCGLMASYYSKGQIDDLVNLNERSVLDVVNDPNFQKLIKDSYADQESVCNKKCRKRYTCGLIDTGEKQISQNDWYEEFGRNA